MKLLNIKNSVLLRYIARVTSLMIFFFILMGCSEEGTSTTRDFDVDDLVGNVKETTWILKSAVLDTPFDPDGDGPMLPLSNIKPLIFQMFHFFDKCSSVEEIPIQFKRVEEADTKFQLWVICPSGQGVSSQVGSWRLDTQPKKELWWFRPEIDDPADLIWWTGFLELFPVGDYEDGKWIISGTGEIYFIDKINPERDHVRAVFSFVLEENKP